MSKDWRRLGRYVRTGRIQAGYPTRTSFAKAISVSERTLSKIEKGTGDVGDDTWAKVELAIGWKPGSADTVLAGGEPTPVTHPEPAAAGTIEGLLERDPSLRRAFEELPKDIRELVIEQAENSAVEVVRLTIAAVGALRKQGRFRDKTGYGQSPLRRAQ